MTNLDGHKWKRVRQTTMPTFSAAKLESMCPSFYDSAQITIRKVFKLTYHILIGRDPILLESNNWTNRRLFEDYLSEMLQDGTQE